MHRAFIISQVALLLLLFLLWPSTHTKAFAAVIEQRGTDLSSCCTGDCSDEEIEGPVLEAPTSDGPTNDRSPGIGIEFECGQVRFESATGARDKPGTDAAKGMTVGNRQGTNWRLTADTTTNEAGILNAEYILNGKLIKIGTGAAAQAAADVESDLIAWDPSAELADTSVTIADNFHTDWKITEPMEGGNIPGLRWAPQVTAPLPLGALNDLYSVAVAGGTSPLLGSREPGRNIVHVTKDFFQSSPNGITSESVTDDVLGFFSLVLSYAKAAKPVGSDESYKELTSIMPRTDFTTIFDQVKSSVPGTLYDIIKVLACYKNSGNSVQLDEDYCSGTVELPIPGEKMDSQKFGASSSDGREDSCTVQEWIQSIQNGPAPDRLTVLDRIIDGQIGGLADALENVLNTNRAVPLFEFRRLRGIPASQMQSLATRAEQAIIDYHNAAGNHPATTGSVSRMRNKRQAASAAVCSVSANTRGSTATKVGSSTTVLPDLGELASVLDGLVLPTGSAATKVEPKTTTPPDLNEFASEIEALFGPTETPGPASSSNKPPATQEPPPPVATAPAPTAAAAATAAKSSPTFAIFLSNNSISIGEEDNANNGTDLRNTLMSQLRGLCPDTATSCDSTRHAEIDDIVTIVGEDFAREDLTFTIQDSYYQSPQDRDRMLAASVATWQQAAAKSCKAVDYEYYAERGQTCEAALLDRRELAAQNSTAEKRYLCEDCIGDKKCTGQQTICSAPDHINPVYAGSTGPYDNHMNIQLTKKLTGVSAFDEFICDLIIDGLTALAVEVAPELVEADLFADVEFQALCADLVEHIGS